MNKEMKEKTVGCPTFHRRIKTLREERRMTQRQLASDLELTQNSIYRYEVGLSEPQLSLLVRMSNYFGVSTDYLLGKSNERRGLDEIVGEKEQQWKAETKALAKSYLVEILNGSEMVKKKVLSMAMSQLRKDIEDHRKEEEMRRKDDEVKNETKQSERKNKGFFGLFHK